MQTIDASTECGAQQNAGGFDLCAQRRRDDGRIERLMGREHVGDVSVAGVLHRAVKLLLESDCVIFRGAFKRRVALAEMSELQVGPRELCFKASGELFQISMTDQDVERWHRAMTRPPPSLADKLGLKGEATVFVIGLLDDETLREAVAGRQTDVIDEASMCIGVATTTQHLEAAVMVHQGHTSVPLWIVYPKGSKSALTEAEVRDTLRARGYMDTKVSAVSERFTATRFNHRLAQR